MQWLQNDMLSVGHPCTLCSGYNRRCYRAYKCMLGSASRSRWTPPVRLHPHTLQTSCRGRGWGVLTNQGLLPAAVWEPAIMAYAVNNMIVLVTGQHESGSSSSLGMCYVHPPL